MPLPRHRPLCALALLVLLAGGALVLPLLHAAGHEHAHAEWATPGASFEVPPCELCQAPLGRAAVLPPAAGAEVRLPLAGGDWLLPVAPCALRTAVPLSARAPPGLV
ncbi:MAG: hypothetical protein ACK41D_04045 [Rubricoccaceae bacterium]